MENEMTLYDMKDEITSILNDYINNEMDIPQDWRVWGTMDGWQINDTNGDALDIGIVIVQEVKNGNQYCRYIVRIYF